jgi:hypothetical protein
MSTEFIDHKVFKAEREYMYTSKTSRTGEQVDQVEQVNK